MRWERRGTSQNVEDRRGAPAGGGGRRGGRRGGLGIMGTVAVLALAYFLKVDPSTLFGVAEAVSGATGGGQQTGGGGGAVPAPSAASDEQVQFVSFVLDDTQATWRRIFQEQGLPAYQDAQLVLFSSEVQSACGPADSGVGPFYCPGDNKVYIDLVFFQELHSRFRAPGDFAQAYVLAHEIGHHVQTLTGTSRAVRAAQREDPRRRNDLQIRMELQADCYAGVWAFGAGRRNLLEMGDLEEGLSAAAAVGDDRLQQEATGRVERESWTHGSSDMRMRWFRRGYQSGDMTQCDAFQAPTL